MSVTTCLTTSTSRGYVSRKVERRVGRVVKLGSCLMFGLHRNACSSNLNVARQTEVLLVLHSRIGRRNGR